MQSSGIKETATRLLGEFYDLAGGNPTTPVPLGAPDGQEGAAARAGMNPQSTECQTAAKYLSNLGYIKAAGAGSAYTITVSGIDRMKEVRDPLPEERKVMSEKTQRRLVSLLAIAIAMGLSQPVSNFIREQIPERRGIKDDLAEAVLEGLVRMTAIFLASVLVRQLTGRR